MELRDGQHIGVVTKAFEKVAPSSCIRRNVFGMKFIDPTTDEENFFLKIAKNCQYPQESRTSLILVKAYFFKIRIPYNSDSLSDNLLYLKLFRILYDS